MPRPSERQVRRRIERANRKFGGGDRCHGCGRHLRSGELTLIGHDPRDDLMVVGTCCGRRLLDLIGIGMWLAARDVQASWLASLDAAGTA